MRLLISKGSLAWDGRFSPERKGIPHGVTRDASLGEIMDLILISRRRRGDEGNQETSALKLHHDPDGFLFLSSVLIWKRMTSLGPLPC